MISNEERQEVMQRLRINVLRDQDVSMTAVIKALGIELDGGESWDELCEAVWDRMCDLIDRPTCKMLDHETSGHRPNGQECSCCGEVFILTWRDAWNYCPHCGAEIEGDMECIS